MKDLLLEPERWYDPRELDLELGGVLMEEAARIAKERESQFINEHLAEDADAPG